MASRNRVWFRYGSLIFILFLASMICCGKTKQEQEKAVSNQEIAIERWPEEGIPVIAWSGEESSLPLYSSPGVDTPASHLAVQQNQQLQWDKSLILVKKLGKLKIVEPCVISGYVYDSLEDHKLVGGKTKEFTFSPGIILDVVCYAAEGDYVFYYQDEYIEMSGSYNCQQMLLPPQTQWWVHLKRTGRHLGWAKVDGEKVSVVDRRF